MQGNAAVVAEGQRMDVASRAAGVQLLTAFLAMQPEWQKALLDIAEVYAERYPRPMSVYIV